MLRLLESPAVVLGVLAALVALIVYLLTRTTWSPGRPLRVARRRSWGETLVAAWRMYASRPVLFLGIGLLAIPIAVVVALLQSLLIRATSLAGIDPDAEGGGFRVALAVGIGTVLTLLTLGLVQAAIARAIAEIDGGRKVGIVQAYRMALDSIRPLLGALAIAVAVVAVLSISFFLIPFAIWLVVRWALLAPIAELEEHSAVGTLRRSGELVRLQWLKVGTLVVAASFLAIVAGPLLGALLILLVDAPFELVNVVAGLVYAVAMPFVGITTTYVYYDTLVRERLAETAPAADELPAEI